jgi:hypothetical protein
MDADIAKGAVWPIVLAASFVKEVPAEFKETYCPPTALLGIDMAALTIDFCYGVRRELLAVSMDRPPALKSSSSVTN